jgi:hypothetical protein
MWHTGEAMSDFKGFLKTAFPFIATAASVGGPPAVFAANMLGKYLGAEGQPVKIEPTEEAIHNALAESHVYPERLLQAQNAEREAAIKFAEMNFDSAEKLEALAVEDRKDARDREKTVRDRTPEIGFYFLLIAVGAALYFLFKYPVPDGNKAIVFSTVGGLVALATMAGTYFYGTTRGSERKTELLAQAPAIDANSAK